MSTNPVIACSVVIATLALTQEMAAQNRLAHRSGYGNKCSATGSKRGDDTSQVAFVFERQRR